VLGYVVNKLSTTSNWIILLHGFGGNSKIWYKQIDEYKKHFNVLEIDLYSHGLSKVNLSELQGYTFEDIAIDVIKLMNKLKIYKAHFAGISLGTIIANQICNMVPHRVASMVLGGAVTSFNYKARFFLKLGDIFNPILPPSFMYNFFAWILMPKKNHEKSRIIFSREAEKLAKKEFNTWFKLIKSIDSVYKESRLSFLNIPKIYIMGSEDHMFLNSIEKDISTEPRSKLHILHKCGHICNIEKANEFNDVSIKFFIEHTYGVLDEAQEFVV